MGSTINPAHSQISFCPSSIGRLFFVEHEGKTHELPQWQQTAITITGIVGVLLFGIGALFALGLSYYFRTKLVEQLTAKSPTPQPNPVVNTPVVTDPNPQSNPVIVNANPPQPPTPTLPGVTNIPLNPREAMQAFVKGGNPVADAQIAEQVKIARDKIDAMTTKKSIESTMNDIPLQTFSTNGRHFIHIRDGGYNYTLSEFTVETLPRGIYCIYPTSTQRIKEAHSAQMNQVMIDAFGADDIYHIISCAQVGEMQLEKIHRHQMTLYGTWKGFHDGNPAANRRNIEAFKNKVTRKYQ